MAGIRHFKVDQLQVSVYPTREILGREGAKEAGALIRGLLAEKDEINIMFASSPSQMDVLSELLREEGIDWSRVNAFHMDEYIGMPADAPQSFGNYLRVRFFDKLPFRQVFYIDGTAADPQAECARYADLLRQHPLDISFLGIGENGHLAFNDPHIADFEDPLPVKINDSLDETCIRQQVTDGWFERPEDVPTSAITVTIPALLAAPRLMTLVPGSTKRQIVKKALEEPISTACPGSIIRRHPAARLLLDEASASLLERF